MQYLLKNLEKGVLFLKSTEKKFEEFSNIYFTLNAIFSVKTYLIKQMKTENEMMRPINEIQIKKKRREKFQYFIDITVNNNKHTTETG